MLKELVGDSVAGNYWKFSNSSHHLPESTKQALRTSTEGMQ